MQKFSNFIKKKKQRKSLRVQSERETLQSNVLNRKLSDLFDADILEVTRAYSGSCLD